MASGKASIDNRMHNLIGDSFGNVSNCRAAPRGRGRIVNLAFLGLNETEFSEIGLEFWLDQQHDYGIRITKASHGLRCRSHNSTVPLSGPSLSSTILPEGASGFPNDTLRSSADIFNATT